MSRTEHGNGDPDGTVGAVPTDLFVDPGPPGIQAESTDVGEAKRLWRSVAASARSSIEPDHDGFGRHLADFLDRMVPSHQRVVVYLAMGDEVDLAPFISVLADPDRRLALTRTPPSGHRLTVHPWGCEMESHPYGYRQPVEGAPEVEPDQIGCFLVPGLAFGPDGMRLGRGKGYYDRLLSRVPGALRVGITGDYVASNLARDEYDIAMTHLAFSTGVVAVPVKLPGTPDTAAR